MAHRSSAAVCSYGPALLRWWATSANRQLLPLCPSSARYAPAACAGLRFTHSSTERDSSRSGLTSHRTARAASVVRALRKQTTADLPAVTENSLEAADKEETEEDEAASSTPAAIELQLAGLNALSDALRADLAEQNRLLLQLDAAASQQAVQRMKQRANALRTSYSALLDVAYRAHQRHWADARARPSSRMSSQLAAMERVWVDTCKHSQPREKAFTALITAYGREARRTRIKDLVERWQEDKESFERRVRASGQMKAQDNSEPSAMVDADMAEVREAKERKRVRAVAARRKREVAMGLPASVSLYPDVKMDTMSYNATLTAYLSSLHLSRLTSQSRELSFPLALLPLFRPDGYTVSALMQAHGSMGETARVVALYEEYKRIRSAARAARGGARELQSVRERRKKEQQYVYAGLIMAFAKAKDVEAAEAVWSDIAEKARKGELVINRVQYHSMLAVYAATNQHEKMRAISSDMKRAGLPMNGDSVCTVLSQLCRNGHVKAALMLHNRIPHGSLGVATQTRSTYMSLLTHLADRADVPFLTVAEVYRQGLECGLLRSRDAHLHKWVLDLRNVPLELVPVVLHLHLTEMLETHMATVKKLGSEVARKTVPRRGLLVLLSRSAQQKEQALTDDREEALAAIREIDAPHAQMSSHRLSVGEVDWDEERTTAAGLRVDGEMDGQEEDEQSNGGAEQASTTRSSPVTSVGGPICDGRRARDSLPAKRDESAGQLRAALRAALAGAAVAHAARRSARGFRRRRCLIRRRGRPFFAHH